MRKESKLYTLTFFVAFLFMLPTVAFPSVTVSINTANGDAVTDTYSTTNSTVTLAGTISTTSGTIERLVWDNIDTDSAGITLEVSQPSEYPFTTAAIPLKAGVNEILLTGTASDGLVGTDKITVTKTVAGPAISSISANAATVRMYEKYEVTFSLDTCASKRYYLWSYDLARPTAGLSALPQGVSAYATIATPTSGTKTVPAFHYLNSTITGHWTTGHLNNGAAESWKVRYSPTETGTHTVTLHADDSCGSTSVAAGTFTASRPLLNDGFVQVSTDDSRYFKHSSGKVFWPRGPAVAVDGTGYSPFTGTGVNLRRPWLSSYGIFSTNWARWWRSDDNPPGNNEGAIANLNSTEHYPTSELSRYIIAGDDPVTTPTGSACALQCDPWNDSQGYIQLENSTNYLVKLRLKTVGTTNLNFKAYEADYFWGTGGKTAVSCANGYSPISAYPSLIGGAITQARDWHTIVYQYASRSTESSMTYFAIYITGGSAYIDQISIKKDNGDGTYGPELVRHPRADMHTYVEDQAAYMADLEVTDAEDAGVFLKYVVQDKNDWMANHLQYTDGSWLTTETTSPSTTYGYAQGAVAYYDSGYNSNTKGKWRWLQEQWWRYIIARWGYSTAIHSWEFCNEHAPTDVNFWRAADNFAKYMHEAYGATNRTPHLACTSTWCCWNDANCEAVYYVTNRSSYDNIDYADHHSYQGNDGGDDGDFAQWIVYLLNNEISPSPTIPLILSEIGVDGTAGQPDTTLTGASDAVKTVLYHDAVWVSLHPKSGFMGEYWWPSDHLPADFQDISTPFNNFIKNTDLHKGNYVDATPSASSGCIIYGQKNLTKKKAVLWLRNSDYNWTYCYNSGGAFRTPAAASGNITLTMNASTRYIVEKWSTTAGTVSSYSTITSNGAGLLTIPYTDITTDAAYKIYAPEWRTAAYNNRRTSATPEKLGTSSNSWSAAVGYTGWASPLYWGTPNYENISLSAQVITGGAYAYIGTTGYQGALNGRVHAFNPATGVEVWSYPSPPTTTLKGGFAHALTYDDYLGGTVFGATTAGEIVALNASDGSQRWKYETNRPGGFSTCPVVEDYTLIVTGRDGYVYALTLAGSLVWEKNIGIPIANTPAADDGVVYFVDESIIAHALYVSDGSYVSGWPSAQYYGGTARNYWPVLTDDYMLFTTSRTTWRNYYPGQTPASVIDALGCGYDDQLVCNESAGPYLHLGATGLGATFRTWLDSTNPYEQVMFSLNRDTAARSAVIPVTYLGGGGGPHVPPVVRTDGTITARFRPQCSVWDGNSVYTGAFGALGLITPATGVVTQILPTGATGTGATAPTGIESTSDETVMLSAADNLLFVIHMGLFGVYDFTANTSHLGFGERDTYGGYDSLSHHRQEWNGTERNQMSISNGRVYFVTGGRIIAAVPY